MESKKNFLLLVKKNNIVSVNIVMRFRKSKKKQKINKLSYNREVIKNANNLIVKINRETNYYSTAMNQLATAQVIIAMMWDKK